MVFYCLRNFKMMCYTVISILLIAWTCTVTNVQANKSCGFPAVERSHQDKGKRHAMVMKEPCIAGNVDKITFYAGALSSKPRLSIGLYESVNDTLCSFKLTKLVTVKTIPQGLNTINVEWTLSSTHHIGFTWLFYGVVMYDGSDDDMINYCNGDKNSAEGDIVHLNMGNVGRRTYSLSVHYQCEHPPLEDSLPAGPQSSKKGLCIDPALYECGDLEKFTGISWWYDWQLTPEYPLCSQFPTWGRIPMQWGWPAGTNITGKIPQSDVLLGWNEPNFWNQSNINPASAAVFWPQLTAQAGGRTLVSPSAAPCGGNHNVCSEDWDEWFEQFTALCPECDFNYTATHFYVDEYPPGYCDEKYVMEHVDATYNATHGKPVWLTEFACRSANPDVVLDFMNRTLTSLEASSHVYRYAWFAQRVNPTKYPDLVASALLQANGSFTALGQFYNTF